jgi:hypothetical protein
MPRFQNADKETLLGLYQQIQAHLSALADADMFTVTTVASVVCALLALMLKEAPSRRAADVPLLGLPGQTSRPSPQQEPGLHQQCDARDNQDQPDHQPPGRTGHKAATPQVQTLQGPDRAEAQQRKT